MSQITWKNIAAPVLDIRDVAIAGKFFNNASDSIKDLMTAGKQVVANQDADEKTSRTDQLLEQFRGQVNSLDDLRNLDSNSALRQKFGNDAFNFQAVDAFRSELKNKLQDIAVIDAMKAWQGVLESGGNQIDAQRAMFNSLTDKSGVLDPAVLGKSDAVYDSMLSPYGNDIKTKREKDAKKWS
jgi:hypothetical protein